MQTSATLFVTLYRRLDKHEEARAAEDWLERFKKQDEMLNADLEKIRRGDRNPELGRQIGAAYLWMGLEDEGLRWLQSVLQDNPNDAATKRILEEYEKGKRAEGKSGNPP